MELSEVIKPVDRPRFRVTITIPPPVERNPIEAKKAPSIFMIKLIREVSGLGLREAKDLYEAERGFKKDDFRSQEAYHEKIESLIYYPFTFTVPALYTRAQLYRMVSKHTDKAKFAYHVVNDPSPLDLSQTERANLNI